MFNKTYIDRSESKVVAVTKEIERTISPDKVVDMYDKVKDAAESKILREYLFDDNQLHGVVLDVMSDYQMDARHTFVRFTLNGAETIHKFTDKPREALTREEAARKLADSVANEVAHSVVNQLLHSVFPKN